MMAWSCILLVDDDEVASYLNVRILRKYSPSAEILVVKHGRQAQELLLARQSSGAVLPEVIFCDIRMPIMGGFEFLELFGATWAGQVPLIRIVMLSSSVNERDVARATEMGANGSLDKPLSVERLAGLVAGW